ncbi:MAG: hypothetical protein J7M39_05115, partial [Anaerolineae bacterium]|nr:hypothetical protein [Anaerolineae bacterium]
NWEEQELTWHYQDWHWLEGTHTLRVEYFEGTGGAQAQFWWNYAATAAAAQAMPPSPTYGSAQAAGQPAAPAQPASPTTPLLTLPGPWTGEYFNGRDLAKVPVVTRTDPAINFDWKWEAPVAGVPANQFAVRWTGTFTFEAGQVRFTTTTDDGVRIYVDGTLILDNWRPMRGTRYVTVQIPKGTHTVRMEYFEALQAAKARLTWMKVAN